MRLAGGQGTAWRAGHVVLKPADSVREGQWFADVYDALTGPGFRVPRPVRAVSGDWVAQGWTAWQWVGGTAADWSGVSPRWPELIAVSRALHAALAGVPVPGWRATVENPWTIGDQVAWGERDPGPLLGPGAGQIAGQVRRLLAALRPVDLPDQLIHADLAGNVLFADGAPPAVIDFSPLYRPAGLPLAIVAVDALMWRRARPEVARPARRRAGTRPAAGSRVGIPAGHRDRHARWHDRARRGRPGRAAGHRPGASQARPLTRASGSAGLRPTAEPADRERDGLAE